MSNWTHPNSKPVLAVHKTTNERLAFPSAYALAKRLGVSQGNVRDCIGRPTRSIKGYNVVFD